MSKVSYSLLSLNFSKVKGLSVKQVGTLIGGKVGANISGEIFRNGCAIRLSYAFNYSGLPIRRGFGSVSTGGDGKLYLFRVNDMLTFLKANISRKPLVGKTSSDFKGKQGIIVFLECSWADATGHVDLYNGSVVEGTDYSADCKKIHFYELK